MFSVTDYIFSNIYYIKVTTACVLWHVTEPIVTQPRSSSKFGKQVLSSVYATLLHLLMLHMLLLTGHVHNHKQTLLYLLC